ncbi:hypothetical protein QWY16_07560 [Planococcus shenhongbingii]|uniref:hypothetical protein n=1 Tax=Planococcus shenhongbingii TaxID=3058398 RepID=UPI002609B7AA|nr:hypothetical protein [Planococcus sp. N016]WKA59953.1 hypothetical protein QWY16_07560 [Planococcus sp. N016]
MTIGEKILKIKREIEECKGLSEEDRDATFRKKELIHYIQRSNDENDTTHFIELYEAIENRMENGNFQYNRDEANGYIRIECVYTPLNYTSEHWFNFAAGIWFIDNFANQCSSADEALRLIEIELLLRYHQEAHLSDLKDFNIKYRFPKTPLFGTVYYGLNN